MPALVSNDPRGAQAAGFPSAVWRAGQMGTCPTSVTPSGYPALDAELPNGGWPSASLIELLLRQPGIGEMRLLRPALAEIGRMRRIALIQPPHPPQAATWMNWGLPHQHLLWIKARPGGDALWAAEQILRNGSCGALLLWQPHVRSASLRRLHLAAQASGILFWTFRPLACAPDPSVAPLRLGLHPAHGGLEVALLKRRGPHRDAPLYLALDEMPASSSLSLPAEHALMDQRAPAAPAARNLSSALV